MLRPPVPNADTTMLENCGKEQLIGLFETCLKTGSWRGMCSGLPQAWGNLFSGMFLSTDDLVRGISYGEHRLTEGQERLLREFIRADSRSGGTFVLEVIKKGGMIDRAALALIADLSDLAALEHSGTTALHLLTDACDKTVRPSLIRRAGIKLLSGVYDSRGIPVLLSVFALGDLNRDDLDAIAQTFSEDDLVKVMNRNRTGKNALGIFAEACERLKRHTPGERNRFFVSHAVRTAAAEEDQTVQVRVSDRHTAVLTGHAQTPAPEHPKPEQDHVARASEYDDPSGRTPPDPTGTLLKKIRPGP